MGSVGAGRRCRIRAGTANQAHSDNAQNSPGARAPHHMRLSRADTGCIPAMGMRRGVFAHRAGAWQALAARYLQSLLFFQRILAAARTSHRRSISAGPRGLRLVAAVETHHGTGLGPFNPLVPCITVARTCDTGQRFASPLHQAEWPNWEHTAQVRPLCTPWGWLCPARDLGWPLVRAVGHCAPCGSVASAIGTIVVNLTVYLQCILVPCGLFTADQRVLGPRVVLVVGIHHGTGLETLRP